MCYVIPTNLVCVFFGTAIPASTFNFILSIVFNARRMRTRVTVVGLFVCVCVSVTTLLPA